MFQALVFRTSHIRWHTGKNGLYWTSQTSINKVEIIHSGLGVCKNQSVVINATVVRGISKVNHLHVSLLHKTIKALWLKDFKVASSNEIHKTIARGLQPRNWTLTQRRSDCLNTKRVNNLYLQESYRSRVTNSTKKAIPSWCVHSKENENSERKKDYLSFMISLC